MLKERTKRTKRGSTVHEPLSVCLLPVCLSTLGGIIFFLKLKSLSVRIHASFFSVGVTSLFCLPPFLLVVEYAPFLRKIHSYSCLSSTWAFNAFLPLVSC